ncbi:inactive phospholipase D5-like isoform X1 [Anguilla rostrata]|uniref:inactive phospholipase D5-like isoform X1 n=1 Tax=Anguilla rostrata TaxID=7938 RepID=UPI0030CBCE74
MSTRHGQPPAGGLEQRQQRSSLEGPPVPLSRAGSFAYSGVQQQGYAAGVWLRRKDRRLERSQQKCIAIFALVCCFAVLLALIFSAVDVWGEDEDGITEENCSTSCQIVLVENIPEEVSFSENSTVHLPLSVGLHLLLDLASRSVEIVSPDWALTSADPEADVSSTRQARLLFQRLQGLGSRGVNLKVASDRPDSAELRKLSNHGAEVRYLNLAALTKGQFRSSFWVVDRKHMYIGSGGMDWHSLSKVKEFGVIISNCSCLVLDLHRIFSLYWQLQYKDFVPSIWSKRLSALYSKEKILALSFNNSRKAKAYMSSSPDVFCPKDRTRDIDAIFRLIQDARRFIYISVTDYLPLINRTPQRYWSRIDGMLREALILRGIKVKLLISCWKQTHPLTFNFVWSLKSLCMGMANCSLEVKFFSLRDQKNGTFHSVNHNKFMVTDTAVYIGSLDWLGNEFAYNVGVGLVISQAEGPGDQGAPVVGQVKALFERDWFSCYAKSLQPNKLPECSKLRNSPPPLPKAQTNSRDLKQKPSTLL